MPLISTEEKKQGTDFFNGKSVPVLWKPIITFRKGFLDYFCPISQICLFLFYLF